MTLSKTHLTHLGLVFGLALAAHAQAQDDIAWGPTGVGDYNVGANWPEFGFVPAAATFNESAIINNGGTAFLTVAAPDVGGVSLGTGGTGGTLEIRNGGSLSVVDNGVTSGTTLISGGLQAGTLIVQQGGTLVTAQLNTAAGGGNSITLGGGPGAGVATLTTDAALIRSELRFVGTNTNFTTGSLQLGGQSNLTPVISGPSVSPLTVNGFARLDGILTLEFDGHTPSVGDSWTVVNAAAIARDFTNVVSDTAPGPGLVYDSQIVSGGLGQQAVVSVEEVLTLKIARETGQATLLNESGVPVGISGYEIRSASGALNPAGWNSLEDQSIGGFANSINTNVGLGELAGGVSTSFNATGVSLGSVYIQPAPPAFGTTPVDDVIINLVRDDGRLIGGVVEFDTAQRTNSLLLTIDPATGNARLTNDSFSIIGVDVYSVSSESDSLLVGWDSLADQGVSTFQEANPSPGRLSELDPTGNLAIGPGASIDLDGLWNTSGVQDVDDFTLTFRDETRGEFTGSVVFDTLVAPSVLAGDYNNDGRVDAADYTVWRDTDGTSTLLANDTTPGVVNAADYTVWANNFGATAASLATAVPEPTSLGVCLMAIGGAVVGRRRLVSRISQRSPQMTSRVACLAVAFTLTTTVAQAQTTVTSSETNVDPPINSYTDGNITVTPFGPNGATNTFGDGAGAYFGPAGGSNNNGVDDIDGDPRTTDDRESLDIQLASGFALTDISFGFTRANPILITGFGADPLASFTQNSFGGSSLAFDSSSNTLAIYYSGFSAAEGIVSFNNPAASDGQTLTVEVSDFFQGGPLIAFTGITYDAISNITTFMPGDVDESGAVTLDDYEIIRANYRMGTTRLEGDLNGDGTVSLTDYTIWENDFNGSTVGLAQALGVPEPTSLLLVGIALSGAVRRR